MLNWKASDCGWYTSKHKSLDRKCLSCRYEAAKETTHENVNEKRTEEEEPGRDWLTELKDSLVRR